MKLFQRSLLHYVFWVTFIYLCVGSYNVYVYRFTDIIFIQMIWLFMLALPLWVKPLAKFLNTIT
jgi:hypothetical protein